MENRPNDRRSLLMLVSSMLIFGTIGVFRRYIPVSSAFLAFSRGVLGGLCILLFLRLKKKNAGEKIPRRVLPWLIVSGMLIGVNWILLFEAYNYTTVAVATLCYYMEPTIVMLLSPLFFREKLTVRKTACAAVAILGMVLVSGVVDGGARGGTLRGALLGLGAAVFYSAVVILNNKIRGVEAYRKTCVQLLSAGLVMVPYLFASGGFGAEGFTPSAVILLLVVGILHTGIAYVLYFGSMDGLRVQSVAILSYIDPVAALLFSAFLLREPLSLLNVLGAVMIIGSAVAGELENPAHD
jgi:RarD protein